MALARFVRKVSIAPMRKITACPESHIRYPIISSENNIYDTFEEHRKYYFPAYHIGYPMIASEDNIYGTFGNYADDIIHKLDSGKTTFIWGGTRDNLKKYSFYTCYNTKGFSTNVFEETGILSESCVL